MRLVSTSVGDESLPNFIEQALKPKLPYSLPLLRRCQYHINQQSTKPGPEIWVVSGTTQSEIEEGLPNARYELLTRTNADPWLAVHIDLTNAGQTQIWTFASWEVSFSKSPESTSAVLQSSSSIVYQQLFDTLLDHIRETHIPQLPREPPEAWLKLKESGKIVSLPFSRSKILFGTLAECIWPFLERVGTMVGQRETITREDKGYLKYILATKASSIIATEAPSPLYFAPMQREHLQVTLDRTDIPRSMETLLQIHNIALFNQDKTPVAWGMLGKDASLSSLHTEPEYRRRGLAEIVSKRLLADQIKLYVDSSISETSNYTVYSHADVSGANVASRKVMEKLGAKVMWKVAWIEVELGEPSKNG